MKKLIYNDEQHEYRLAEDSGIETIIPSVTQIASAVTGKTMAGIPPEVLAEARKRGKAIHKDVEDRAFKTPEGKWIKSQIPGIFLSEHRNVGEIDGTTYGGTCDVLVDGEIDDIKAIHAEETLYWTIQLNLYAKMFDGIERLNILWVPKSGNYRKVPIQILNDGQMSDIMAAYRDKRILAASWLAMVAPEAPTLELIVYSKAPGQLATNARAILETVRRQLAGYKAENYSETNISDAKRDRAELNNASKALSAKRLEIEREAMEPYAEFKKLIAETVKEIGTASSQIDAVVKEVEQRERNAKRLLIIAYFASLKCELFSLEQIFNPAWVNKGIKIKDVEIEITVRIEKVKSDLLILDRIGEPEAKAHYLSTLNLDGAIAEADRIKANRERLAKIEVTSAEPRASVAVQLSFASARQEPVAEPSTEELLERKMLIRCTLEKIRALSAFMNDNGIYFEKL